MEPISRVKKYENLRKQIEHNTGSDELAEEQIQQYEERLNTIDPSIFKKVNIREDAYIPERERTTHSYQDETPASEFRNEYLDDFINEVREYNIKKGNRENENTQIDILNQLNAVSRTKRTNYIEDIQDEVLEPTPNDTMSISKDDIAAQVQILLQEDEAIENVTNVVREPLSSSQEEQVAKTQPIPIQAMAKEQRQQPPVAKVQPRVKEPVVQKAMEETRSYAKPKASVVPSVQEQMEAERERRLQQKLVEETQQLRTQLNEYEDDLNDLSEGVEKTNKMLNIILCCLILALLVIIAVIIYWVVGKAGGIV